MPRKENLSDQIATVLRSGTAGSEKLKALLQESEAELNRLETLHADKRQAALDPLLSTADIREIRQVAEDAAFEVERLKAARERLAAMLADAIDAERKSNRAETYRETVVRRDALVKRIAEEYPAAQQTLTSLIIDIAALSAQINDVNADLPQGQSFIEKPEGMARGFSQVQRDRSRSFVPPLIVEMVVPILENLTKPAWPPTWNGHAADDRLALHDAERMVARVVPLRPSPVAETAQMQSGGEAA